MSESDSIMSGKREQAEQLRPEHHRTVETQGVAAQLPQAVESQTAAPHMPRQDVEEVILPKPPGAEPTGQSRTASVQHFRSLFREAITQYPRLALALVFNLHPNVIALNETLLEVAGSGLNQLGPSRPISITVGTSPQRYPASFFLFGQNASLDRLAELVSLAQKQLAGCVQERLVAFPGPTVNDWFTYLCREAANDNTFSHPACQKFWLYWKAGWQASVIITEGIVERIAAEAKDRGLPEKPDACLRFWCISDVLAASAAALDRWLTDAGIAFDPAVDTEEDVIERPRSPASSEPELAQSKTPRDELIVPLPDGRNLVLPIAELAFSATAGEGMNAHAECRIGIEKLADLLAFTDHLGRLPLIAPGPANDAPASGVEDAFDAALRRAATERREQQAAKTEEVTRARKEMESRDALDAAWHGISFLATNDPRPGEDLKSKDGWYTAYAVRLRRLGQLLHENSMIELIVNRELAADAPAGLIIARELVCLGADQAVPLTKIEERLRQILREVPMLLNDIQKWWFQDVRQLGLPRSAHGQVIEPDRPSTPPSEDRMQTPSRDPGGEPAQQMNKAGHQTATEATPPHQDGVEGGCWLRWQGIRHDIAKGNVYKLVAFMWDRESASYDALVGPVFESAVQPQTVRSYTNKANNDLDRIGVPWRLSTDSVTRQVTKKRRE
jgi:hypothetical protein